MESPFVAKEDDPMARVSHCSDVYCTRCVQYRFVQCSPVPLSSHYTVCFNSNAAEQDPNLIISVQIWTIDDNGDDSGDGEGPSNGGGGSDRGGCRGGSMYSSCVSSRRTIRFEHMSG